MTRFLLALLLTLAGPSRAQDVAGEFDYFVLSLSWSPNWCALEGDDRGSPQCADNAAFGWILHGLWPQYEQGWPEHCRTRFDDPTRAQTAAMANIMGTSGLAWYQWNKHGVCSGLPSADYYALARAAYVRLILPLGFARADRTVTLHAVVVEEAFLQHNPDLRRDQITITCDRGYIQEARVCLTRDLAFRRCGADVIRDCTLENALLDPIR